MPTIRLGDVDRERFGCPEWLDVPETLPVRDAEALEEAGGKYLDWFRRDTAKGFQSLVWLALHRAGITKKLDELADLDLGAILIQGTETGKASGSGSGTTPRTSASSTRPSRRTRSKTSS
jgi:hypothetical protein